MKRKITWLGLSILIAAGMLLAACGNAGTATTQQPIQTTPKGPVVLTVTNGNTVKTYSLVDLQDANTTTGYGGEKEQDGTIVGPYPYITVALTDLLYDVGGITAGQSVKITASDGSSLTLTYDQITNSNFNVYNSTGNQITTATKPIVCIIYSENGSPLDSSTGPLELGTISTMNFITDQSMWLKMVQKIEIIPAQ
ncbi:MAG: hypothetical protein ACLPVI_06530 [Dehalococcoidales bacterium]